ncbi:MAG: arsenate reductase family protein [Candidatus Acidiferrales bacterium]
MKASRKPSNQPRKRARTVQFIEKHSCTTCRKSRAHMQGRGFQLQLRDLGKHPLSAEELEKLIGRRDYRKFLNTRNELYRRRKMKDHPPSRAEAIRQMAAEPNLIRRPVIVCGGRVVLGFDEEGISGL